MRVIGLMSGTSMDGIDVALIETDGATIGLERSSNGFAKPLGPTLAVRYSDDERALLVAAIADAQGLRDRDARPGRLAEAEAMITRRHVEALERFLALPEVRSAPVDLVGFHGQTVLHRPADRVTVQIGDGQALADRLGIPVVFDMRAPDVAAGGQGAPLVPIFHQALAAASGFEPPLAILNIGGVANVTFVGARDDLLGFDTGPGNALLDDLLQEREGRPFDEGGATAARGRADEALLTWMLGHPFFGAPPPKSLDRNAFSHRMVGPLSTPDAAATLAAFTVEAVVRALRWNGEAPRRWIVGGGGARNATLMRLLRQRLGAEVQAADEIGWSTDHLEAQAFAFLAARCLAGLPITFPGTTGVAGPTTGGTIARPRGRGSDR